VPAGTEGLTEIVSVVAGFAVAVSELGEKLPLIPDGKPEVLSDTASAKPLNCQNPIAFEPLDPASITAGAMH
jgi:hypothetical protein